MIIQFDLICIHDK